MNKPSIRPGRIIIAVVLIAAAFLFVLRQLGNHGPPVAIIRVTDTAGQPVADAVLRPAGLRTKAGPYRSGWYGWRADQNGVSNSPVRTADDGAVKVPYPRHVFEQIETGVLCFEVNHPNFVPIRPECDVDTTPPAGSPLPTVVKYWWNRVAHGTLVARPAPIILRKGAILRLSAQANAAGPEDAPMFAQVKGLSASDTNTWFRPEPNVLVTRRLEEGPFIVRAVRIETNGAAWFSQVVSNTATLGQTNLVNLAFTRGATVRGEIDASVPRPVRNGRVIVQVWPLGYKAEQSPPTWHAWAKVRDDGGFEIPALPPGDLEIVALCDGFVSTNGPGQFQMRYPQKHVLGSNDITVIVGMEPTARLEVSVADDKGTPLPGARVVTWPNVRYGEWSATILGSDCYNMVDWFTLTAPKKPLSWNRTVADFEGVTGSNGVAVLPSLPATVKEFTVEHKDYVLPAVGLPGGGRKERQAGVVLTAGETNRAAVQLEPREKTPITHY